MRRNAGEGGFGGGPDRLPRRGAVGTHYLDRVNVARGGGVSKGLRAGSFHCFCWCYCCCTAAVFTDNSPLVAVDDLTWVWEMDGTGVAGWIVETGW